MSLFPYTGPMTSKDILDQVYSRKNSSLQCSDRTCGAQDCDNCRPGNQDSDDQNDKETDWYTKGRFDGYVAVRSSGGTRGAEWNAEQKQIVGIDKEDYIKGFNDSLDEHEGTDDSTEENKEEEQD